MRQACRCASGLLLAIFATSAWAESWPERPIRTIVPFPAGGVADVVARVVMDQVAAQLGQPIVIENRTGAGGTLGAAQVASAAPDGYTLLVNSVAHTIAPATFAKLPYDPVRDFAAIAPLARQSQVLVVAPARGYTTLKEFVAWASAKHGALSYASSGAGSGAHFAAERFLKSAGLQAVHVPFRGSPQALSEVMTARVDFFVSPLITAAPLIREGKVLGLAVTSAQRDLTLPDVPTTQEAGVPNAELDIWCGLFAPAKTPVPVLERLYREVALALKSPQVISKLSTIAAEPMTATRKEFESQITQEIGSNIGLAKAIGLQPN